MTGWHFALLMFFQIAEQKTGVWGEEFRAYLIDKADFEKVWKARCYDNELSAPDYK